MDHRRGGPSFTENVCGGTHRGADDGVVEAAPLPRQDLCLSGARAYRRSLLGPGRGGRRVTDADDVVVGVGVYRTAVAWELARRVRYLLVRDANAVAGHRPLAPAGGRLG